MILNIETANPEATLNRIRYVFHNESVTLKNIFPPMLAEYEVTHESEIRVYTLESLLELMGELGLKPHQIRMY